ncbi:biotin synthase BioB [Methanococcus vannielii]|uniref:Biotin synthase n=1 Tax=Methanococcus vannielii (strain ATCC 35089 / DSM 1224 / JCM 13029 / OCM 148 / SB) TaxID=406327 RepID=BIOB_METVS|nr:biotin synthase BioB [Methanococcus vannielii]A6UPN7.2 RecName: Full=Biotin synthase [Methanococcus vannielii SB]
MNERKLNKDFLEIYEMSISGKIKKEDALEILKLDVYDLLHISYHLKKAFNKEKIETCSIINAKSGFCSENCNFCSQSIHNNSKINIYGLKSKEEILKSAKSIENYSNRFSIVSSGKKISEKEFEDILEIIDEIKNKTKLKVCVSLGLLNKSQLKALMKKNIRIHNNLETSKNYFKNICTTHEYEDKVDVIKNGKKLGLQICSGGIFGLGEDIIDRIDLLYELKELNVDSISLNLLNPIEGTKMREKINSKEIKSIEPIDALKSICISRIIMPERVIRLCGGREYVLKDLQSLSLLAVDGLMIGNYLTTSGRNIQSDLRMIEDMGFKKG